jgi:hypothetical protein
MHSRLARVGARRRRSAPVRRRGWRWDGVLVLRRSSLGLLGGVHEVVLVGNLHVCGEDEPFDNTG